VIGDRPIEFHRLYRDPALRTGYDNLASYLVVLGRPLVDRPIVGGAAHHERWGEWTLIVHPELLVRMGDLLESELPVLPLPRLRFPTKRKAERAAELIVWGLNPDPGSGVDGEDEAP
jgi:hypothetical protein